MRIDSIEVIVQDSETGKIYDISNITGDISIEGAMENSSGKCSFSINTNVNKLHFAKGSTVSIKINGVGQFFGYIFKTNPRDADSMSITAYDQTRYLKNKSSYVFSNITSEGVIYRIGQDFGLRLGTLERTNYILPERIHDNKTLGDIIQNSLDFVLIGIGKQYIIRDEFGYLCQRNIDNLRTNIVIGDYSLLNSYSYEESIDNDTYNQIKLYRDNEETGKREVFIVKDSNNIARWGLLQYFESVDEDINDAQATEKANMLLLVKNRVGKTLSLKCDGDLRIKPGTGFYLVLTDITGVEFNQYAVVTKVTHNFSNMLHQMNLEVRFE